MCLTERLFQLLLGFEILVLNMFERSLTDYSGMRTGKSIWAFHLKMLFSPL